MFRKSLLVAVFTLVSSSTFADDLSLEPSINGEVSKSGEYSTQMVEDYVNFYLRWIEEDPYDLYKASPQTAEASSLKD